MMDMFEPVPCLTENDPQIMSLLHKLDVLIILGLVVTLLLQVADPQTFRFLALTNMLFCMVHV